MVAASANIHFHVCQECCHIWSHEAELATTTEEAKALHTCPVETCKCGPYYNKFLTEKDAIAEAEYWS